MQSLINLCVEGKCINDVLIDSGLYENDIIIRSCDPDNPVFGMIQKRIVGIMMGSSTRFPVVALFHRFQKMLSEFIKFVDFSCNVHAPTYIKLIANCVRE